MLNKAMIIGHLGADPEMRYTANGNAVTNFSVATSRKWTPKDGGEQREETEWHRVVAWNKLAEICAQYLTKGRLVFVEGRMQTRSWDGDDGQKHYMAELIAENVKFLGGGNGPREGVAAGGGFAADPTVGNIDADDLPF